MDRIGTVKELWRYPVKSMGGERLEEALVTPAGIAGDRSIYARSLGINVNLIWGVVLIVTAGCLLALAARGRTR